MSNAAPWDEFFAKLGAPLRDTIERFESLGHNCEFGFIQAANGSPSSSLLTWALIEEAGTVIRLLEAQFAGLYARDQLVPILDGALVRDTQYGVAFHSQMLRPGADGAPRTAPEQDAIYAEDHQKLSYLAEKTLNQLREGNRIWVYKTPFPMRLNQILDLHGALSAYGRNQLLVVEADPSQPAGVNMLDQGLYTAHIPSFSPGDRAWHFDPEAWNSVLHATARMAGPAR